MTVRIIDEDLYGTTIIESSAFLKFYTTLWPEDLVIQRGSTTLTIIKDCTGLYKPGKVLKCTLEDFIANHFVDFL